MSADGLTIENVNPAFARMHGCDAQELSGRPTSVLQSPARRIDGSVERIVRECGHHIWETEHVRRDGSGIPLSQAVDAIGPSMSWPEEGTAQEEARAG